MWDENLKFKILNFLGLVQIPKDVLLDTFITIKYIPLVPSFFFFEVLGFGSRAFACTTELYPQALA
jgi:hypothetical protein